MEETAELERIILQSVDEAVIATDLVGKIIYWNEGATKLYGWQRSEVIGLQITTVTPSKMSQEQAEMIMKQLGRGDTWTGEFAVRKRDGTEFVALVTDRPMYRDGQLYGVVGVSIDINDVSKLSPTSELRVAAGHTSPRTAQQQRISAMTQDTLNDGETALHRTRGGQASSSFGKLFNEKRSVALFESLGMLRSTPGTAGGKVTNSQPRDRSERNGSLETKEHDDIESMYDEGTVFASRIAAGATLADCKTSDMMAHIFDCICALKAAQCAQNRISVAPEESTRINAAVTAVSATAATTTATAASATSTPAEMSIFMSAISTVLLRSDGGDDSGVRNCAAFCALAEAFPQSDRPPSLAAPMTQGNVAADSADVLPTASTRTTTTEKRAEENRSFLPLHWGTVLSSLPGADIEAVKTVFASNRQMLQWPHTCNMVPAAREGDACQRTDTLDDLHGLTPVHLLASMREPNMELASLYYDADPVFGFHKSLIDGPHAHATGPASLALQSAKEAVPRPVAASTTQKADVNCCTGSLPPPRPSPKSRTHDGDDPDDGDAVNDDEVDSKSRDGIQRFPRGELDEQIADDAGFLPLHMAAIHSDSTDMFTLLLKINVGAVRERAGPHGRSPLHFLVSRPPGHTPPDTMVELALILLNADPDIAMLGDIDGVTPFHLVFWRTCAKSAEHLIRLILTMCPGAAKIIHRKYDMYPLHLAVSFLPAQIAEAVVPDLLSAFKDAAGIRDGRENLPALIAAEACSIKTVELILEAFPDALHARDAGGRNLFHRATSRADGDAGIVQYLSKNYPDTVKVVDEKGLTPLHFAVYYGKDLKFLRAVYEADPSAIETKTAKHGALPAHVALVLALEYSQPTSSLSKRVDFFRFLLNKYPPAAKITFWDSRTPYAYCLHKNAPSYLLRILLRADPTIAPATLYSLNYRERRDAMFLAFSAKTSDDVPTILSRLRDCDAGELSLLKEVVSFL